MRLLEDIPLRRRIHASCPDNRPLWQAKEWVKERPDDRYGAAELRAIADWLVPEEPMIVEGGRSYEQAWLVSERERLRRLLLDEADKAEARDE
jgi:hypothetical protein